LITNTGIKIEKHHIVFLGSQVTEYLPLSTDFTEFYPL